MKGLLQDAWPPDCHRPEETGRQDTGCKVVARTGSWGRKDIRVETDARPGEPRCG